MAGAKRSWSRATGSGSGQPAAEQAPTPAAVALPSGAACLVGTGFRRGLLALTTSDAVHWEFAWQELANATGPEQASRLVDDLSGWVREVHRCAGRPIQTLPPGCPGFCRDECLAISMIAAGQHSRCPAMRACAFALLGSAELGRPMEAAARFANNLAAAGQVLSDDALCDGLAALPVGCDRRH